MRDLTGERVMDMEARRTCIISGEGERASPVAIMLVLLLDTGGGGEGPTILLFVADVLLLTEPNLCAGAILAFWPEGAAPPTSVAGGGAATAATAGNAFFLAHGGVLRYSQLGTGLCFTAAGGDSWAASSLFFALAAKVAASPVGFAVGGVLVISFPGVVDVVRGVAQEASSLAGSIGTGSVPGSEMAAVVGVLPMRERRRTTILFINFGFLSAPGDWSVESPVVSETLCKMRGRPLLLGRPGGVLLLGLGLVLLDPDLSVALPPPPPPSAPVLPRLCDCSLLLF